MLVVREQVVKGQASREGKMAAPLFAWHKYDLASYFSKADHHRPAEFMTLAGLFKPSEGSMHGLRGTISA